MVNKALKSDGFALGFVAAIAGLIGVGFFLQKSIRDVQEVTTRRAEARKVAFKIKELATHLADSETGQRGFLLTGDKKYLAPYKTASAALPLAYKDLETHFHAQADQYARLKQLEVLIDHKLSELAYTVELKQAGKSQKAIEIVKQGQGLTYMDQLRILLRAMDDEQERLIAQRQSEMEKIVQRSGRVVFSGSLFAIILVASLLILLDRSKKRRAKAEQSLKGANDFLEKRRVVAGKIISIQNQIVTAPMNSLAIMDMVVKLSMDLTSADGSIIEMIDGDDLVYKYAHGAGHNFLGMRIARAGSFSGLCLAEGKALVCNDSESDDRVNREACRKVGLRSMIVVPLQHGGKTIGVLKNYSAKANHFDELSFSALTVMTNLLSAVLGQATEFEAKLKVIADLERTKAELTVSRDLAQSATEAKSLFLANMSHEVRTPLNGILGMAGLLLDSGLKDEALEYATGIQSSGQILLTLVNDILDFSKIEAGRMEFEQVNFDLISTLQDIVKSFGYIAHQKNLEIKYKVDSKTPHLICGDPSRVRQVLTNLVNNAIKFTPKGSVEIQLTCLDPHGVRLRFDIRDTGIGISKNVIKNLFQEFTQADASTTRRYGGTGLGLSICKKLVEQMGGQIGVESEVGRGSNFWFTVKLAPAQKTVVKSDEADVDLPQRETPWRILVAEDNQVNQIVIRKMLEKMNIRCDVAGDGKEAVEALQSRPYDMVLMDCHMPVMDGYDATKYIRTNPSISNPKIPIVAMTANALKGDREKTLAAGMDDYISKPIDVRKLRSILAKWLSQSQQKVA